MDAADLEATCAYPYCDSKGYPFDLNPYTSKPYLCPCRRHLLTDHAGPGATSIMTPVQFKEYKTKEEADAAEGLPPLDNDF